MHDPFLVCGGKASGHLLRVLNRFPHGQRTLLKLCTQFFAFQRLGDDERHSLIIADVINRQDVWMIERRSRSCFLLKPFQPVSIFGEVNRQNFYRDFTVKPGVFGAKTSPMPPAPSGVRIS